MNQKQKGLPKFFHALKLSIISSAEQYFVLLGVLLVVFLYALRDAAVPFAVFLLFGAKVLPLPEAASVTIEIAMFLVLLYIAVKFDGAMGFALTSVATGERNLRELGHRSYKKGFSFFKNALQTGVLLFFGQMLLVCPCFLLMTNFVFSPYLSVYEGIEGDEARARSRQLAATNLWLVFAQSAYLILIGYVLLVFAVIFLFAKFNPLLLVLFALLALFLGLVQSNFIYKMYSELLRQAERSRPQKVTPQFKIFVFASILAVVLVYLGFKFLPYFYR